MKVNKRTFMEFGRQLDRYFFVSTNTERETPQEAKVLFHHFTEKWRREQYKKIDEHLKKNFSSFSEPDCKKFWKNLHNEPRAEWALATIKPDKKTFIEYFSQEIYQAHQKQIGKEGMSEIDNILATFLVEQMQADGTKLRAIGIPQENLPTNNKSFMDFSYKRTYQLDELWKTLWELTEPKVDDLQKRFLDYIIPRTDKLLSMTRKYLQKGTGGNTNITTTNADPNIRNTTNDDTVTRNRGIFSRLLSGSDDPDVIETKKEGSVFGMTINDLNEIAGKAGDSFKSLLKGVHKVVKRKYYYTWWLFDNKADFEKIKQSHKYPRSRGKFKVTYSEVPTKEIANALTGIDGNKDYSSVTGEFLGAMGLTPRKTPFTSELIANEDVQKALSAFKEGEKSENTPIIALGTARAKAISWRADEVRGIFPGGKMRFDISKLNWKWAEWKGKAYPGVVVITVEKDAYEKYRKENKLKEIFDNQKLRLEKVKITLKTPQETKNMNAPDGKAIFENLPRGAQIEVGATLKGYTTITTDPVNPFVLHENTDAIVVMEEKTSSTKEPRFILTPITSPFEPHNPLDKKFGSKKIHNIAIGNKIDKSKGAEYSFRLKKGESRPLQEGEGLWYEIFIVGYEGSRRIITPKVAEVTVASDGTNRGLFATSIPTAKKEWQTKSIKHETITPSFDCENEFVKGKYRIYCLAKKVDVPFMKLAEEHQKALLDDAYLSIKNSKLWDYNYIEFTVGGEGKTSTIKTKGKKKTPEAAKAEIIDASAELKKHARGKATKGMILDDKSLDFNFLWTEKGNKHLFELIIIDLQSMLPASKSAEITTLEKNLIKLLQAKVEFDKPDKKTKKARMDSLTKQWGVIQSEYAALIGSGNFTFGNVLKLIDFLTKTVGAS